MTDVRQAGRADVEQVATTLARAFQDDPVVRWLSAPGAERYARSAPRTFRALLEKTYLPKAEVHLTDDGLGAVVWVPPDKWKAPASDSVRLLPAYLRLSGKRLPRVLRLVSALEKRHAEMDEPHWYIPFIGTDPSVHGKGRGTALLTSVLAQADREGQPTYLESSSPRNQSLYHRHAFQPIGEVRVDDSPPLTVMWRQPR
ncbi:MAG TPA: GNAT family N-acetyltransferase [Acidimicrobiales bacterium]